MACWLLHHAVSRVDEESISTTFPHLESIKKNNKTLKPGISSTSTDHEGERNITNKNLKNDFLVKPPIEHEILHMDCFCSTCRHLRVQQYSQLPVNDLHNLFHVPLSDSWSEKYHSTVLQIIAAGKTFRDMALLNTGYKYFGAWSKVQPPYSKMEKRQRDKFNATVNLAVRVYENWDEIVANLTNCRMDQIDARKFSMYYFDLARSEAWCLQHNEQLRKGKEKSSDRELYSEEKYQEIKTFIFNSGVLGGMDTPNDPHIAAMLMKRLSSNVVNACTKRSRTSPSPQQLPTKNA